MHEASKWTVVSAVGVAMFIACGGSKSKGIPGGGDDNTDSPVSTDDGGGGGDRSNPGSDASVFRNDDEGGVMVADSDCKAGHYVGKFDGSYSSSLIFGAPLAVKGDVNLTLNQAGKGDMMCMVEGEGFVSCSEVFILSGGTITGVANQVGMLGDARIGGYPYFCSMTGTLDCMKKKLVNGWIQCTYCVGDLVDAGVCSGWVGAGGQFAGPLQSDYDITTHSFTMGSTWNGAEALKGNDGTMPPDGGGMISDYLALDGGYGFGKYGGSGTWNATLK